MTRPATASLVEVGPRDGLQNEPDHVPTETKVAMIRRLAAAGATRIEAVSFVHPGRVPRMADAEAVMRGLRGGARDGLPGVSLSGLVLNERGFARALDAGVDEVTFVIVASETFSARNQGGTIAEVLARWAAVAREAARAGLRCNAILAAAFGCPFEGEVPVPRVAELARAAAGEGAAEVALADTIGVAGPADVEARFAAVAAAAPGVSLRAHFHDTRGTGLANADAALRCGVATLDASLGGLGGCPFAPGATGNVATEDLAYMLARDGVATGLDLPALAGASAWMAERLGRPLPGKLARVPPWP